jgi:hypothetical protein
MNSVIIFLPIIIICISLWYAWRILGIFDTSYLYTCYRCSKVFKTFHEVDTLCDECHIKENDHNE